MDIFSSFLRLSVTAANEIKEKLFGQMKIAPPWIRGVLLSSGSLFSVRNPHCAAIFSRAEDQQSQI